MPSPIIIIGFPPPPPLHQNPKNPKWTQLLPILKNPKSLPGSAQTHSEPHTSSSSDVVIQVVDVKLVGNSTTRFT
ncbi:hypothetical protein MRB53_022196 [Persea americana]|uniref:Uncharacterized protein n=1 Tax=Persea americana TaxID=3435 RepID=A0ACC2L750_PERAE|nr:hypothetical protein MRB53_022196 [Persea americana]